MNCDENKIVDRISKELERKDTVIVAIDGRCASGKTTFGKKLAALFDCNLIHMDDFFLPPQKRTAERLSLPGGNFDKERFVSEVLVPIKEGREFEYRPFNCKTSDFSAPIFCGKKRIYVIEGAYSCHPDLFESYDITVFMTVCPDEQLKRITERNGEEQAVIFKEKWIPLEEGYFSAFSVMEKCDYVIANG